MGRPWCMHTHEWDNWLLMCVLNKIVLCDYLGVWADEQMMCSRTSFSWVLSLLSRAGDWPSSIKVSDNTENTTQSKALPQPPAAYPTSHHILCFKPLWPPRYFCKRQTRLLPFCSAYTNSFSPHTYAHKHKGLPMSTKILLCLVYYSPVLKTAPNTRAEASRLASSSNKFFCAHVQFKTGKKDWLKIP